MNDVERCISEWVDRVNERDATIAALTKERDALKKDQEIYKFGCSQRAYLEKENDTLQADLTRLRELVGDLPVLNAPVVVCLNGNWTVKSTDSPLKYTYKFESQQTAVAVCKLFKFRATLEAGKDGQG